jgi:Shikimate 5-dehydrogenase
VIHARRRQAAEEVVALADGLGVRARAADLTPVDLSADLLVSTLPADAAAPWAEIGTEIGASSTMALLDVSYHPWPTPLAAAWLRKRPDAPVASGKDMLLWQALEQVRLMTGQGGNFDDAAVLQAMRGALG